MKVWAITYNTFREAIRNRILYNLLAFAVLLIGLSVVLGRLSIAERERITLDVGLSAISVFGVLMSIFLGITLISKEIEGKTIHTLVAKPVQRWVFVVGRYLGLMLTILINIAIMSAAFGVVMWYITAGESWPFSWPVVQAIILIFVELGIITAVALVFSTFSTPILSAIFTLSFFVIGRLTAGIKQFGENAESAFYQYGADFLYYAVPNLTNYVRIESALYGEGLPPLLFLKILLIGALTSFFFIVIAISIFQRRDFV